MILKFLARQLHFHHQSQSQKLFCIQLVIKVRVHPILKCFDNGKKRLLFFGQLEFLS
jgi:hypothetical protein